MTEITTPITISTPVEELTSVPERRAWLVAVAESAGALAEVAAWRSCDDAEIERIWAEMLQELVEATAAENSAHQITYDDDGDCYQYREYYANCTCGWQSDSKSYLQLQSAARTHAASQLDPVVTH